MTQTMLLQRLEGFAILLVSLVLYAATDRGWLLFALLLLIPDLSIAAYWFGNKPGQLVYNAVHNYVLPLLLALLGYQIDHTLLLAISLIWLAHIGMDRTLGYGLKEDAGFAYTHLGRMGQAAEESVG